MEIDLSIKDGFLVVRLLKSDGQGSWVEGEASIACSEIVKAARSKEGK